MHMAKPSLFPETVLIKLTRANGINMTTNTIRLIQKLPLVVALTILIVILGPLYKSIFFGIVLACLGWNLQDLLETKTPLKEKFSRLISPSIIASAILLLLTATTWSIVALYKIGRVNFEESKIKKILVTFENTRIFNTVNRLSEEMNMGDATEYYQKIGEALLNTISEFLTYLASSLPRLVIGIFICAIVFMSTYLNRKKLVEFRDSQNIIAPKLLRNLGTSFKNYSYSTFFATWVCALTQGSIIAIGVGISGVGKGILWGTVATLLALLPYVGTAPVTMALTIFLYITEGASGNMWSMVVFGILASLIDNILRPHLLKRGQKQSPLISFLAIFGGLFTMGPAGIFIAPILCGISMDLLEYKWTEEFGNELPALAEKL